jgi:5'-3' exonuclease
MYINRNQKMGIKNLNLFLKKQNESIFQQVHISFFSFKRVAVDISLYMCKFKAVSGDRWLQSFVNLIVSLRRNNVHCVFIYDGEAPNHKDQEKNERKLAKETLVKQVDTLHEELDTYSMTSEIGPNMLEMWKKRKTTSRYLQKPNQGIDMSWIEEKIKQKSKQVINISSNDFDLTRELFDILDVPYLIAVGEAEKMCSKLCIEGKVDAVLSDDTDVIAYRSPISLSKYDIASEVCTMVEYQDVIDSLGFNSDQFLDFCIMCGTDYNKNIPKIGPVTSYKLLLEYDTLENIQKSGKDTDILNYVIVRKLFREFAEEDMVDNISYCGIPDYDRLINFASLHNLKVNIDKLRKAFEIVIVLEDSDGEPE